MTSGLVSSVNRPGANVTGVSFYDVPVIGKRLALLRELVPKADVIAVLQDPNFAVHDAEAREVEEAARTLGQKIVIFNAPENRRLIQRFLAS